MYGPRRLTSRRIVWLAVAFPVAWCLSTLIRGELVGWYPYPLIDVGALGYGKALVNCVWVAVLLRRGRGGLATLDGWLTRVGADR